jgi:hypothetical protein
VNPIHLTIERLGTAGAFDAVETAARMVPGVISVRPDTTGRGVLVEAAKGVQPDDLIAALLKAGFVATLAG